MPAYREILKAAYNESPEIRDHCNYLLYAVAKKLGIVLPSGFNADQLIDHMSRAWFTIPTLSDAEARSDHQFVVAGLKSSQHVPPRTHGHVAILIPRTSQAEHLREGISWPYAWSAGVQSQGTLSIGSQIWSMHDVRRVRFFTPSRIERLRTVPSY